MTDEVTHEPLAGVPVCAVINRFQEGEERFCTQTDGSGEYEVGELAPAEYGVEFLPGSAGLNYLYEAWEDERVWVNADPVTVGTGAVTGIDAELGEGGEMRGRVVNALSGLPVAGVEVCAEAESLYVEEGCATTNPAGEYTIYGLGTSSYVVGFSAPEGLEMLPQYWNGQSDLLAAEPVGVTVGSVTEGVDAALVPGARISGTVTDAMTGEPVSAITACAFGASDGFIDECGESNAAGHYTIRRLRPGSYKIRLFVESGKYSQAWYTGSVCASEPLAVSALAGEETSGVDVQLAPEGFSPLCGQQPGPPPPRRVPIEVNRIRSRSDGTVAITLRSYRAGRLALTARTGVGSTGASKRNVVVARRETRIGVGHPTVRLRLNRRGVKLRQTHGRLRARLVIAYEPQGPLAFSLEKGVLFTLPAR